MGFTPFYSAAAILLLGVEFAAAAAPAAATSKVDLRIRATGRQSFSLYEYIMQDGADLEAFWHVTEPGMGANVVASLNSTITKLVSQDMTFRALILVDKNGDSTTAKKNPFIMCFFNQMAGGPGATSFEVTSGKSTNEPQSVDSGAWRCVSADYGLEFFMLGKNKELIAQLYVKNPKEEL
eukprot:TRINITY_DN2755_c0_g1_i2.p1 TRINITY_DN2755_c0_g1~~TRINITY_DN2755_c0_g1_i2.p1  ORF type:complete len:204 (+),score=34.22 TRINITY_DN2755_c0_g1_i2:74-613(+)